MGLTLPSSLLLLLLSSASSFVTTSHWGSTRLPRLGSLWNNHHPTTHKHDTHACMSLTTFRGGGSKSSSTARRASLVDTKVIATDNWALLSERGREALRDLIEHDAPHGSQRHVYADWPPAGTDDEGKRRLAEQVSRYQAYMNDTTDIMLI
jgi:hypothetical protein